jgi:predicted RNase H-like nuclease
VLPYSVVAAATPCGSRWLVASAKMHAVTFAPEAPKLYPTFIEILEERPSFSVIVMNAALGFRDDLRTGVRTCDREARSLLGRRGSAVHNAPTRMSLKEGATRSESGLDAVTWVLMPKYREVADEMSPYRQRVVYGGNPELSYYTLNGDRPLRWSKKIEEGRRERRRILENKIPGINKVIDVELGGQTKKHLLDVAALLWTSRRVFGHAAVRLPFEAEWDSEGLRMEMVY